MLNRMIFLLLALPIMAFAGGGGPGRPSSTGLHLLHSFWRDMTDKKIDKISNYMSSQFQGLYLTIPEDKFGELTLIRNREWPVYTLSDLQQTQRETDVGAILILTYTVQYSDYEWHRAKCQTMWLQVEHNVWRLMSHSENSYNIS